MTVIIGNKKEILSGNRYSSVCKIGICVPNITNVPLEMVTMYLELGIFSDKIKRIIVEMIAFTKNIRYDCPYKCELMLQ
jgi:hypothetical protein